MGLHSDLTGSNLHIARTNTGNGSPAGVVNATIVGEFYWDLDNDSLYIAEAVGTGNWFAVSPSVDETVKSKRYDLVFDSPGAINIGTTVPANSRVNKVVINVTTAFDGVTESTLEVGDAGDPDRFCEVTEVNLALVDMYTIDAYYNYASSTQITGTYVQDGATQGAASIEVIYSLE